MRHLSVLLVFVAMLACTPEGRASQRQVAFAYVSDGTIQLPRCPAGCRVRGYRKFAPFVAGFGSSAEALKQPAIWRTFFREMGLTFPHGGFIVYDHATDTCFVATIPGELDLIEYLCHVP